jgi:predicted kinase
MAKLIIFSGPPGVGKSTLSYKLAQQMKLPILTKDQIERSLENSSIVNPNAAYDLLLDQAKLILQNNSSVILDAVFGKQAIREQTSKVARDSNSELDIIVCSCSDVTLWRKRIDDRPEVVDGWTPANWDEVQRVQSYFEKWTTPHLELDAVQPIEENFSKIMNYLNK